MTADDELTALPDPSQRFEELLSRVKAKDHKKRALMRLPFELGEDLALHVGVYNLVRRYVLLFQNLFSAHPKQASEAGSDNKTQEAA